MKVERRSFVVDEFRIEGDEGKTIVGHAAIFNSLSEDLGGFREQIASGSFARAIGEDDVRALFNHDANLILGRNRAGTLKMSEDERGLKVEITPPDTVFANDLMKSIKRGDVTQMSFAFRVVKENWEHGEGGEPDIRTLQEVELFDVSPVTYPAYKQTDVGLRSLEDIATEGRERLKKKEVDYSLYEKQQVQATCE